MPDPSRYYREKLESEMINYHWDWTPDFVGRAGKEGFFEGLIWNELLFELIRQLVRRGKEKEKGMETGGRRDREGEWEGGKEEEENSVWGVGVLYFMPKGRTWIYEISETWKSLLGWRHEQEV